MTAGVHSRPGVPFDGQRPRDYFDHTFLQQHDVVLEVVIPRGHMPRVYAVLLLKRLDKFALLNTSGPQHFA
jgi:hypothetical protein